MGLISLLMTGALLQILILLGELKVQSDRVTIKKALIRCAKRNCKFLQFKYGSMKTIE